MFRPYRPSSEPDALMKACRDETSASTINWKISKKYNRGIIVGCSTWTKINEEMLLKFSPVLYISWYRKYNFWPSVFHNLGSTPLMNIYRTQLAHVRYHNVFLGDPVHAKFHCLVSLIYSLSQVVGKEQCSHAHAYIIPGNNICE